MLAPLVLIHRPSKAGATLAAGPRSAVWVTLIVGALLLAGVVLGAMLWAGTATHEFVPPGAPGATPEWQVRQFSLAEAWYGWAGRGALLEIVKLIVLTALPLTLAFAALAWVQLPLLHRSGSAAASYRRAFAVAVSAVGVVLLLAAVFAALSAWGDNLRDRLFDSIAGSNVYFWLWVVARQVVLVSFSWLLIGWLACAGRAVRGAVELRPGPPLPHCVTCRYDLTHVPENNLCPECGQDIRITTVAGPAARCAQCGYDLMHVPADGRCPECGFATDLSLRPGLDRPGWDWQIRRGYGNWVAASFQVIFHPDRFYRKLRVWWPEGEAVTFARWHYVLIGLLAAAWMCLCMLTLVGVVPALVSVVYAGLAGLTCALLGWCMHRGVAAVVASWWLARGAFPDFYPVWQVIRYEAAFLWVFCAFNGLLITSLMLFDSWMTQAWNAVFSSGLVGEPVEMLCTFCGNVALFAAWLWRYGRARRAVQWANF